MGIGLGIKSKYKWYIFGNIFRIFKINNNKIVVDNFLGRGYGDNPKYIVDVLLKSERKLDIVWVVNDKTDTSLFPKGIRTVKYGSIKSIYEWITAKIWIDNVKQYYKLKRKGQYYLQTWHGGVSLKRVEKAVEDSLDIGYIHASKRDSKIIDAMISNSSWQTNDYKTNFWFNGPIFEFGLPRNDIFFHNTEIISKKVKDFFEIPEEYKIILFAPTLRNHKNTFEQKEIFSIDSSSLIKSCETKFNNKYVLINRFHPGVADQINIVQSEFNKDGNFYSDMQELLVASDILITDFSSSIFDFVLKSNKVFLFAKDYDDYLNKERGLNFDLKKDLKFNFANSQDELIHNISNFNEETASNNIEEMKEFLGICDDGNASLRIAEHIMNIINES